ncbi:uncharacterized protein [Dermacentor andersoni]|uniref:uncharacterized protein n=1 Tax=Dermacentor andersoni TaxID=34620 RepID=UPI003B3B6CD2
MRCQFIRNPELQKLYLLPFHLGIECACAELQHRVFVNTRQLVGIATSGMAYGRSNEYTPAVFSFTDEATPSANRGNQGASFGAYPTISDDTWHYQWNTQPRPITRGAYDVGGVIDNASTTYLLLGSSSSIDHERSSTSRAGIEESTPILEDGATIPQATCVDQWNTQYQPADGTSTDCGHTPNTDTGTTRFTHPVYSSLVASTSYARMEESSDTFGRYARNATGTGGMEQQELSFACANVSSRQDALHGHANEHTSDTAHTCRACDQSSVKVYKFVEHCRNRRGKKHKCKTCDKLFNRADYLAKHYRTHTDERPHKCKICDKSFRQSAHLDRHKRIHTGEKAYLCKICGKSFTRAEILRNHQHTHAE